MVQLAILRGSGVGGGCGSGGDGGGVGCKKQTEFKNVKGSATVMIII